MTKNKLHILILNIVYSNTDSQTCIIKTTYLFFNCFMYGWVDTNSVLEHVRSSSSFSLDCVFTYSECSSFWCTVLAFGVCFARCLLSCSVPCFLGFLIRSLVMLSFSGEGLSNSSQLKDEISLIEGSRQCRLRLDTRDGVLDNSGRLQDIIRSSKSFNETSRKTEPECLCDSWWVVDCLQFIT